MSKAERGLAALAAVLAAAVLVLAIMVVKLNADSSSVTVQPPCYVQVPGAALPPGGHWC